MATVNQLRRFFSFAGVHQQQTKVSGDGLHEAARRLANQSISNYDSGGWGNPYIHFQALQEEGSVYMSCFSAMGLRFCTRTNLCLSTLMPFTETRFSLANTTLKSIIIAANTISRERQNEGLLGYSKLNSTAPDGLTSNVVRPSRLSDVTTLVDGYLFMFCFVLSYLALMDLVRYTQAVANMMLTSRSCGHPKTYSSQILSGSAQMDYKYKFKS